MLPENQSSNVLNLDSGNRLLPISVVVTTYNEEPNLERCLRSLVHAAEVIVVDSFSTDRTVEIARSHSVRVVQHAYESHPKQWRWILDELPLSHEWVFAVDADFVVTDELWRSLESSISDPSNQFDGFYVRHAQVFMGRLLRHGTLYPRYWLRIFRKGVGGVNETDLVDVHFKVSGNCGYLDGDLFEDNVKDRDLSIWVNKQLRFAKRQAKEEVARRLSLASPDLRALLGASPDSRIENLKLIWFRLPLFIRPLLLFFYRYVLTVGFLDGCPGLVYHFTQALFYRFAVDVYLYQLTSGSSPGGRSGMPGSSILSD